MINTNSVLKRHLSNIIYIENHFGLDLFKREVEANMENDSDDEMGIMARNTPTIIEEQILPNIDLAEADTLGMEKFFSVSQNFCSDLNILPYFYEPQNFWRDIEGLKRKLVNFPLIIIDWQLEINEGGKNGLNVFEEITDSNELLHYYVIYSNELSEAIAAFSKKCNSIKVGEIAENKVAVINKNAIVLFCDKQVTNIDKIISMLISFIESTYGYLPQLFLAVKQQIENKTAILYNEFMGLDSMLLLQLVGDEYYNYNGLEEEVLISIVMNQLKNSIKIENSKQSYIQSVVDSFLEKEFSKEDFERAHSVVRKNLDNLNFEVFQNKYKLIKESKCLEKVDFEGLKKAAQLFYDGRETNEDKKIQKKIQGFILFLSICNDKDYYEKYIKLLSLIKFTEYKTEYRWKIVDCADGVKDKGLYQGDVFIDDHNNYLLCISPACQLMRPDKINHTYMFLKGEFAEEEAKTNQKQSWSMRLINREKDKVMLVNWNFYAPQILDFSTKDNLQAYEKYERCYRLNSEYTHKIIEFYSEYIKQIGVEEIFAKRIEEKDYFVEKKGKK